jgi:hypothetical protein
MASLQPKESSAMKPSIFSAKAAAVAGIVLGGLGTMSAAEARSDVVFTIGVQAPAYYAPQPYVVAPRPVVVAPQPVYVAPSPVYVRSGDEWRREQWRREHWRHWQRAHRQGWNERDCD